MFDSRVHRNTWSSALLEKEMVREGKCTLMGCWCGIRNVLPVVFSKPIAFLSSSSDVAFWLQSTKDEWKGRLKKENWNQSCQFYFQAQGLEYGSGWSFRIQQIYSLASSKHSLWPSWKQSHLHPQRVKKGKIINHLAGIWSSTYLNKVIFPDISSKYGHLSQMPQMLQGLKLQPASREKKVGHELI